MLTGLNTVEYTPRPSSPSIHFLAIFQVQPLHLALLPTVIEPYFVVLESFILSCNSSHVLKKEEVNIDKWTIGEDLNWFLILYYFKWAKSIIINSMKPWFQRDHYPSWAGSGLIPAVCQNFSCKTENGFDDLVKGNLHEPNLVVKCRNRREKQQKSVVF